MKCCGSSEVSGGTCDVVVVDKVDDVVVVVDEVDDVVVVVDEVDDGKNFLSTKPLRLRRWLSRSMSWYWFQQQPKSSSSS